MAIIPAAAQASPTSQNPPFLALPNELKFNVLNHFGITDLRVCSLVCRALRQVAYDNSFWRRLFVRDFPGEDSSQIQDFRAAYKTCHIFYSNLARGVFASRVLKGHSDVVQCFAVFGNQLISGSRDNDIRIWDLKTGACQHTLRGHDNWITSFAVAGNQLISGSRDRMIMIWNLETGKQSGTITVHTHWVTSLVHDGKTLFSGSMDCTISICGDLKTGRRNPSPVVHTKGVSCLAHAGNLLISGAYDKTIKVWDLTTRACKYVLKGHTDWVMCLAVHGNRLISGSMDKQIRIWDLETGTCERVLTGHVLPINAVGVAGNKLISSCMDKIAIWDLETGVCERILLAKKNYGGAYSLIFAGGQLISGTLNKWITIWDFLAADGVIFKEIADLFKSNVGDKIAEAIDRFTRMPKKQRSKIYKQLGLILKRSDSHAENAFHNSNDQSSTAWQKAQAIEAYLAMIRFVPEANGSCGIS